MSPSSTWWVVKKIIFVYFRQTTTLTSTLKYLSLITYMSRHVVSHVSWREVKMLGNCYSLGSCFVAQDGLLMIYRKSVYTIVCWEWCNVYHILYSQVMLCMCCRAILCVSLLATTSLWGGQVNVGLLSTLLLAVVSCMNVGRVYKRSQVK